jgi:hypothetical protein
MPAQEITHYTVTLCVKVFCGNLLVISGETHQNFDEQLRDIMDVNSAACLVLGRAVFVHSINNN